MVLIRELDIIEVGGKNYLLNLVNGAVDIIDNSLKEKILNNDFFGIEDRILSQLKDRQYVFENMYEYTKYIDNINSQLLEKEKVSAPNFLIIPTYECNFRCSYCYQMTYSKENNKQANQRHIIERIFSNIGDIVKEIENELSIKYSSEEIEIILMGGEPLLNTQKDNIVHILEYIKSRGYSVSIITNGYTLDEYLPLLVGLKINTIQVTIDGSEVSHNHRRILKDGTHTFTKIIDNIFKAMDLGISISVRINVDQENFQELCNFAKDFFAVKEKYKDLFNPYVFLMEDGGCSGNNNILDEVSAIKAFYDLKKICKEMSILSLDFHGKEFFNALDNRTKPRLKISNCAAMRNQYIFDFYGKAYKCWFGVGNKDFIIGNILLNNSYDYTEIQKWKSRNINSILKCQTCKYRYLCGGGCVTRVEKEFKNNVNKERCVDFHNIFKAYLEGRKNEIQ